MRRQLIVVGCLSVLALATVAARPPTSLPLGNVAGCEAYGGLPAGWGNDPLAGMVRVSGGGFTGRACACALLIVSNTVMADQEHNARRLLQQAGRVLQAV